MSMPEPAADARSTQRRLGGLADGADPAVDGLIRDFTGSQVSVLRHAVQAHANRAGLAGVVLDGFVVAVHELVINAVRHGGGRGRLQLQRDGENLVCEVSDFGAGFTDGVPTEAGRPPALRPGGRGLWLARQLSDTLSISDGPQGVTVTITVCLPASPPALHAAAAAMQSMVTTVGAPAVAGSPSDTDVVIAAADAPPSIEYLPASPDEPPLAGSSTP